MAWIQSANFYAEMVGEICISFKWPSLTSVTLLLLCRALWSSLCANLSAVWRCVWLKTCSLARPALLPPLTTVALHNSNSSRHHHCHHSSNHHSLATAMPPSAHLAGVALAVAAAVAVEPQVPLQISRRSKEGWGQVLLQVAR